MRSRLHRWHKRRILIHHRNLWGHNLHRHWRVGHSTHRLKRQERTVWRLQDCGRCSRRRLVRNRNGSWRRLGVQRRLSHDLVGHVCLDVFDWRCSSNGGHWVMREVAQENMGDGFF